MKKIILKMIVVLLPLWVYLLVFVKYEQHNYYGLKEDKWTYDWSKPLARVREYLRNPSENVILGDSRMNHFDLDLIEELTGDKYVDLSTGGQGVNLTYELFLWANSKQPIKNLVVDASFYQVIEGNCSESAEEILYIAEHPLEYPFKWFYVKEAWTRAVQDIFKPTIVQASSEQSTEPIALGEGKYREDLVNYAVNNIYPSCAGATYGGEQIEYYKNMINLTQKNGGKVKILIPCVQESIWEFVIMPLEIEKAWESCKLELSFMAPVYDMGWQNEISYQQELFADGFHFISESLYNEIYGQTIWGDDRQNVRIYENGALKVDSD